MHVYRRRCPRRQPVSLLVSGRRGLTVGLIKTSLRRSTDGRSIGISVSTGGGVLSFCSSCPASVVKSGFISE